MKSNRNLIVVAAFWAPLLGVAPAASSLPVVIAYGQDPYQFGVLRVPPGEGRHPVVVVIHGGCWTNLVNLVWNEPMSAALTDAGVATWNIEYRRTGDPGGGFPNTLTDVGQAVDKLRELARPFGLDLDRVVLAGHSAGGQLAVWAAARKNLSAQDPLRGRRPLKVAAVIPLAAILDMESYARFDATSDPPDRVLCGAAVAPFMGGSPEEVPDRYAKASPIRLVPIGVPQFLIHGTADTTVPIEQSERYLTAALGAGDQASLKRIDGAAHVDLIQPTSAYWPQVLEEILRVVGATN